MSATKQHSTQQHNTGRHSAQQRGAAPHPGTHSTAQHTAHSTERQRGKPRDTEGGGGAATTGEQPTEARPHGESRSGRPTNQTTHNSEAQSTRGCEPEKARDNGGAQRRKKKRRTERQRRKPRDTKGAGGQQPPRGSQRPGGRHNGGESAQRAEKRQAHKTNNTQRQG